MWVVGNQSSIYFSYYENEHGEQWGARLNGKVLCISGLDIDWEEIKLNAEQAIAENNRIIEKIVAVTLMHSKDVPESITKEYLHVVTLHQQKYSGHLPLAKIMFGTGEML